MHALTPSLFLSFPPSLHTHIHARTHTHPFPLLPSLHTHPPGLHSEEHMVASYVTAEHNFACTCTCTHNSQINTCCSMIQYSVLWVQCSDFLVL